MASPQFSTVQAKPWEQLLAENHDEWTPPLTVHLPINPAYTRDFLHVDAALNVTRRRVLPGLALYSDAEVVIADLLTVQFALDDPPFVPDYRYSTLQLEDGALPIAHAEYFQTERDLLYRFEYFCAPVDGERQAILWVTVSVENTGPLPRVAHVRAKVNIQPEAALDPYHYIPFYYDATKWLPCHRVQADGERLLIGDRPAGKWLPGDFACDWEALSTRTAEDYDLSRARIYVHHAMQLYHLQDLLHFHADLAPGERATGRLALLTNFEEATEADYTALARATYAESRENALRHFRALIPVDSATLTCPAGAWEDIFAAVQYTTHQLLVRDPHGHGLIPTQGGSSERHYVWVWEAVCMMMPFLTLGNFAPVKEALRYIYSLQDSGCPPRGRLTSTAGAIGTTGPRWLNTTGAALSLAAEYYRYARDEAFLEEFLPKILNAAEWIVGEIRATRHLNPDGSRPLWYGLMPFGCATDGDIGYIIAFTDSFTYRGLASAAALLETLGHPRAAEFRAETTLYRADIGRAITGITRDNGYIERKIVTGDPDEVLAAKFEYICGSILLAYCDAIDIDSDAFARYAAYFEHHVADGYFMGKMDRDVIYMGIAEWLWQDTYLRLGEWKKAFVTAQMNFKYGMTRDTHLVQERFSKANPTFTPWQPNGSGNGKVLDMILKSFYFAQGDTAVLLGGLPFAWLRQNGETALRRFHTRQGCLSLEAVMLDATRCQVRLRAEDNGALPARVRFPDQFAVTGVDGVHYPPNADIAISEDEDVATWILTERR